MIFRSILFLIIVLFLSCSKNEILYEPRPSVDPYKVYKEAYDAFDQGDYFFAQKKFSEAEINFEIVELAAKSSIMASYSYYGINFYTEALQSLDKYLNKYPADKNVMYAHYLISLIYFEQITDEKKDIEPLLKAQKKINFFLETYPNNDYATDLQFKKDLIINQLAAKELFIAKYYISVKKWTPAIKRLQNIVKTYDKTIYIEEALHRLVEIHFHLGLEQEAKKYAAILGYNYNSGEWFEKSFQILNRDYKIIDKKEPKAKDSLIKRIIRKIK